MGTGVQASSQPTPLVPRTRPRPPPTPYTPCPTHRPDALQPSKQTCTHCLLTVDPVSPRKTTCHRVGFVVAGSASSSVTTPHTVQKMGIAVKRGVSGFNSVYFFPLAPETNLLLFVDRETAWS